MLGEGQFVASYKFALLIALADLSVERLPASNGTLLIPLADLAERFIEIYWRQAAPFRGDRLLIQNTGHQAAVLLALAQFRGQTASLANARRSPNWQALVTRLRRLLLDMPLWRLQTVGQGKMIFLYKEVLVDNSIVLLPGVAACFRSLYEVVVALIQMTWLRFIQRLPQNQSLIGAGGDLAEFPFGSERSALAALGSRLLPLQHGACFYCLQPLRTAVEVDHFVPWARYPRDLGHNLVLAHAICNRDKSDVLADVPHLHRWINRNERHGNDLAAIFESVNLLHDAHTTVRVAAWCYDQVERGHGIVWIARGQTRKLDGSWRAALRQ